MAFKDANSLLDLIIENPKRAALVVVLLVFLVVIGVWAKALAEWALTVFPTETATIASPELPGGSASDGKIMPKGDSAAANEPLPEECKGFATVEDCETAKRSLEILRKLERER